jgi:hypothetical protein
MPTLVVGMGRLPATLNMPTASVGMAPGNSEAGRGGDKDTPQSLLQK